MISGQLGRTKDPRLAIKIIQGFNCKFRAADFQFLGETIRIFPLLFKGNALDQSESNLITDCQSFYRENEESSELCKILQNTFKDIFCAIISRISHGDSFQ